MAIFHCHVCPPMNSSFSSPFPGARKTLRLRSATFSAVGVIDTGAVRSMGSSWRLRSSRRAANSLKQSLGFFNIYATIYEDFLDFPWNFHIYIYISIYLYIYLSIYLSIYIYIYICVCVNLWIFMSGRIMGGTTGTTNKNRRLPTEQ